jgi:putative molybdopterin biosynthesis protein
VVIASMDYAVARLAGHLAETQPGLIPLVFPMSSLDGLVSLRQGICQMATCHLLDPDTGEYNLPTIHSLFPGQAMVVVRLYNRVEGLLVGAGNPEGIRRIEDLAAGEFRIAKREPGSGVQVWFDHALRQAGANPDHTSATSVLVRSHAEAAQAVIRGAVDAAVGIQALPQPAGIDFIPLFEEPYDLVLHEEDYQDPRLSTFFEYLFSPDFGKDVLSSGTAGGYRLDSTGLRVTHVS